MKLHFKLECKKLIDRAKQSIGNDDLYNCLVNEDELFKSHKRRLWLKLYEEMGCVESDFSIDEGIYSIQMINGIVETFIKVIEDGDFCVDINSIRI